MIARLLLAALLFLPWTAQAEDAPQAQATQPDTKGPALPQLMKLPAYIYAWQGMMAGETPPQWVKDFTTTLDGPPTPSIAVPLDGEIYTLAFTCQPGACENHQLYVLFAPEGRDAWGLLAEPTGITWLGRPAQRIQDAINGALRK